jgi:hypothetical protein
MATSNGATTSPDLTEPYYVTWMETPEPWATERELIGAVDLPLNLDQNRHNAFRGELTRRRAQARAAARALPVVAS